MTKHLLHRSLAYDKWPDACVPVAVMRTSPGKRRTTSILAMSSSKVATSYTPTLSNSDDPAMRALAVNRRRRFILYSLAFATMLALSSVLDVRRAALTNRHAKLQLSLPSASLSSLSDPSEEVPPTQASTTTAVNEAITPTAAASKNNQQNSPNADPNNNTNNQQPIAPNGQHNNNDNDQNQPNTNAPTTQPPPVAADHLPAAPPDQPPPDSVVGPPKHYSLSQQELDDGVDQLIAHVDQEESAANSALSDNSTSTKTDANDKAANVDADSDSKQASTSTDAKVPPNSSTATVKSTQPGSVDDATVAAALLNGGNSTEDVKLNAEDTFRVSSQRFKELLNDEKSKSLVDENDKLTLQALELQATRGDCELKTGSSLFKTDAELASNEDIERTQPIWGAWCLFMGSYKSDAMRDYVTKELAVEHKIQNSLQALNSSKSEQQDAGSAPTASTVSTDGTSTSAKQNNINGTTFDPTAASLDDVMTPEKQSELRRQAEMVVAHLQENDLRYLAALSLQATFGDCGPYGRETLLDVAAVKNGVESERVELRKLREPLFEQTATRQKGALWGAWCVMQGKRRSTAAANLSSRVELLVEQLTKSQEAAEAEENGESDMYSNTIDSAVPHENAT